MRYMQEKQVMSYSEVRHFTHIDYQRDFALAAVDRETDSFAGIARYGQQFDDPSVAEISIAVLKKYQRLGLARYLMSRLFAAAHRYGFRRLKAMILRENEPSMRMIQAVTEEQGGVMHVHKQGGKFEVLIDLVAEPFSESREILLTEFSVPLNGKLVSNGQHKAPLLALGDSDQMPGLFPANTTIRRCSMWRYIIVFSSGLNVEVRPADPDDELRVKFFAEQLCSTGQKNIYGNRDSASNLARTNFCSGFTLVAIDLQTDHVIGGATFGFSRDFSSSPFSMFVLPKYRGVGLTRFLTKEIIRAARDKGRKALDGGSNDIFAMHHSEDHQSLDLRQTIVRAARYCGVDVKEKEVNDIKLDQFAIPSASRL